MISSYEKRGWTMLKAFWTFFEILANTTGIPALQNKYFVHLVELLADPVERRIGNDLPPYSLELYSTESWSTYRL